MTKPDLKKLADLFEAAQVRSTIEFNSLLETTRLFHMILETHPSSLIKDYEKIENLLIKLSIELELASVTIDTLETELGSLKPQE